jgi:hypothetical protein
LENAGGKQGRWNDGKEGRKEGRKEGMKEERKKERKEGRRGGRKKHCTGFNQLI